MPGKVRSLQAAASFVDRVGIALVFPKDDIVLPSLWEAVAGPGSVDWVERDEDGKMTGFTPEMARVWRWKDELAERKLCCAGKHVRGWPSLVSLALLPSLYALTGRRGRKDDFQQPGLLSALESDIAEAVFEAGPLSAPEIRRRIGSRETAKVNRAIDALQRMLVLTRAGVTEQGAGWPASTFDLTARRYRLGKLPSADNARESLASAVLASARELSAPDLAAALGWPRKQAASVLEGLEAAGRARPRATGNVAVWSITRRS